MKKELPDLYSDYLLSSFGYTTAAGLSELLDKQVGHDKITDFLPGSDFISRDLWLLVKETVRSIGSGEGVLISDDTVGEKNGRMKMKLLHGIMIIVKIAPSKVSVF